VTFVSKKSVKRTVNLQESIEQLCVTPMMFPKRWRLTLPITAATEEIEEVVLRVQGIITNKDLPPVQKEK
jgi:hypothetical protein